MSNNKTIRLVTAAALLSCTVPAMAATADTLPDRNDFHALSSLDNGSIVSLSNAELDGIQGGFFNLSFLNGFNIAIMPQFNICLFCFGTSQTNNGFIFGGNLIP